MLGMLGMLWKGFEVVVVPRGTAHERVHGARKVDRVPRVRREEISGKKMVKVGER